jgi:hypothetical protein
MLPDYQDLGLRFQEIKEAYAQAKTVEEKQELLALAWEIARQAEEKLEQLKSEIQRMKKQWSALRTACMVSAAIPKRLAAMVDLLSLGIGGPSVLGANVGSKLFVTLGFVLPLHFIQWFRNNRTSRLKHPVALGATETLKLLVLDP